MQSNKFLLTEDSANIKLNFDFAWNKVKKACTLLFNSENGCIRKIEFIKENNYFSFCEDIIIIFNKNKLSELKNISNKQNLQVFLHNQNKNNLNQNGNDYDFMFSKENIVIDERDLTTCQDCYLILKEATTSYRGYIAFFESLFELEQLTKEEKKQLYLDYLQIDLCHLPIWIQLEESLNNVKNKNADPLNLIKIITNFSHVQNSWEYTQKTDASCIINFLKHYREDILKLNINNPYALLYNLYRAIRVTDEKQYRDIALEMYSLLQCYSVDDLNWKQQKSFKLARKAQNKILIDHSFHTLCGETGLQPIIENVLVDFYETYYQIADIICMRENIINQLKDKLNIKTSEQEKLEKSKNIFSYGFNISNRIIMKRAFDMAIVKNNNLDVISMRKLLKESLRLIIKKLESCKIEKIERRLESLNEIFYALCGNNEKVATIQIGGSCVKKDDSIPQLAAVIRKQGEEIKQLQYQLFNKKQKDIENASINLLLQNSSLFFKFNKQTSENYFDVSCKYNK